MLVVVSIAVLVLAPLFARVLQSRPPLASLLDAFVVVSVAGIVALHVLPQSVELAGSSALLAFVVGMLLPALLHRFDQTPRAGVRDWIAYLLFLLALSLHALLDGAALVHEDAGGGVSVLALGVILHRLPVGLALWVVLRPRVGLIRTGVVGAVYIGGTLAGALVTVSTNALHAVPATMLGAFQALVAGSILHVVTEAPVLGDDRPVSRATSVIGALLAALLIAFIAHDALPARAAGIAIAVAAPYVVGVVSVGLITALAPARVASALGPIGHVVPALALTLALMSPAVFALRLLGVVVIAALSLAVVGQTLVDDSRPRLTMGARFTRGVWGAVDHTLPWLCASVVAVGLVDAMLGPHALSPGTSTGGSLLVVGAALVAAPLYVCAAGITPLVATLGAHGLSVGAVLAVMLSGPSTSWASLQHVRRAHGRRAAWAAGLVVIGTAIGVGLAANALHLAAPLSPIERSHALDGLVAALDGASIAPEWSARALLARGALSLVGVGLLVSLYRQGVRGFVEQVLSPAHALEDAHVHGPSCAHDHGASRPPFSRKGPVHAARVALPFDPRDP